MNKVIHLNRKQIWYPGAAYADQKWIDYLKKIIRGSWLYTDINEFSAETINGIIIKHDTFNDVPPKRLRKPLHTLIMSRHPGLKDFDQIIESDILNLVKPEKFLFSPGINFGDVEVLVKGNKIFEDIVGYQLKEFKMLHDMKRQYLIYRRK
jgi:hypothetical protein|tara:strand:+ start:153 stop:605 length:453 start_codon:yes stop_codon:yes gene_type:complete